MSKKPNTKISYLYRDGANYKNGGMVVVANPERLSMKETRNMIMETLDDQEFFIAHQVGLPELFLWDPDADYDPDDESTFPADLGPGKYVIRDDDHSWHALNERCLKETRAEPTIGVTLLQLVKRFQKAAKDGWKIFEPGKDRPPVDFGEVVEQEKKNVCFHYSYLPLDKSLNVGTVVVSNPEGLSLIEAEKSIRATLEDERFIAHQVGLPEVFCDRTDKSKFKGHCASETPTNKDDHCWHTVEEYILDDSTLLKVAAEPTMDITLLQLVQRFQKAAKDGWKTFELGMERPPVDFGE